LNSNGRSLRAAGRVDRPFLAGISGRVFANLGEYGQLVPGWLDAPGVEGRIADEDGVPVGFALTCLVALPRGYRPPGATRPAEPGITLMSLDLLAIGVIPERQRSGLGGWILAAVIDEAERRARETLLPLMEISLTVAEANAPARALFDAHGFTLRPGPVDDYPSGLAALRMARPLG
jgi:GNAT superfamily N-acetyltransferase